MDRLAHAFVNVEYGAGGILSGHLTRAGSSGRSYGGRSYGNPLGTRTRGPRRAWRRWRSRTASPGCGAAVCPVGFSSTGGAAAGSPGARRCGNGDHEKKRVDLIWAVKSLLKHNGAIGRVRGAAFAPQA